MNFDEMSNSQILNMNFLRSLGATPAFFGLGFIQMKINETYRLHFWHPALSAIVGPEELHDHRYNFTSRVLHGKTKHTVLGFHPNPNGVCGRYLTACNPNESSEPVFQENGDLVAEGSYEMVAGSTYWFPHDKFHAIETEECITLLKRDAVVKRHASILKPLGAGHTCPFSQKIDTETLWGFIEELVLDKVQRPHIGYHLRPIEKGVLGESSKITEEYSEFIDALKQDNPVMAMIELSDLIGAIEHWLIKNHPTIGLNDLIRMKTTTQRAFKNGHRS